MAKTIFFQPFFVGGKNMVMNHWIREMFLKMLNGLIGGCPNMGMGQNFIYPYGTTWDHIA